MRHTKHRCENYTEMKGYIIRVIHENNYYCGMFLKGRIVFVSNQIIPKSYRNFFFYVFENLLIQLFVACGMGDPNTAQKNFDLRFFYLGYNLPKYMLPQMHF